MQSLNILVIMRIFTLGVIVSGVNAEKERFGEVRRTGNSNLELMEMTLEPFAYRLRIRFSATVVNKNSKQ